MKNLAIAFLFFVTLNISCKDKRKEYLASVQNNYSNRLKKFPSFLIDFFPLQIGEKYCIEENIDTTNECISFLYYDLGNNNISSIDSSFREQAIETYNASDSNIVSIKRNILFKENRDLEVFYESIFISQRYYYPVPYFEKNDYSSIGVSDTIIHFKSLCGLTKDFTIYLLESKPGNHWKGLKPSEHMPIGWKNGFSKGVCINSVKGIVIYWFVVW